MKKIIIAAISENYIIGKDGSIPWYSEKELNHFREETINFPVLMGRKTFASLEKPLSERINIVLSRVGDITFRGDNTYIFNSISEVYDFCNKNKLTKLFIIGGSEIFTQFINKVDEILISRMKFTIEGDSIFPKIDPSIWELTSREDFEEFSFEKYRKV